MKKIVFFLLLLTAKATIFAQTSTDYSSKAIYLTNADKDREECILQGRLAAVRTLDDGKFNGRLSIVGDNLIQLDTVQIHLSEIKSITAPTQRMRKNALIAGGIATGVAALFVVSAIVAGDDASESIAEMISIPCAVVLGINVEKFIDGRKRSTEEGWKLSIR